MSDILRAKVRFGDGRTEKVDEVETRKVDMQWSRPKQCTLHFSPRGKITIVFHNDDDEGPHQGTLRTVTLHEGNEDYIEFWITSGLERIFRDAMIKAGRDAGYVPAEGDSVDEADFIERPYDTRD